SYIMSSPMPTSYESTTSSYIMSSPMPTSYESTTSTKLSTPHIMQTEKVSDVQSTLLSQMRVNTKYHALSRPASPTNNLPPRETVTPGVSGSSGFVRIWWRNFPEYEEYGRIAFASWIAFSFFAYLLLFRN
ncbi:24724_t:CDS:1, partial [Racocetra persica]